MLKKYFSKGIVEAGCDEAGRGCLAGPVVAAAVILPHIFDIPLLNDSKQLTKNQRNQLRTEIEKKALAFAIAEVTHEEIDKINILNASILAMHKALDLLKLKPEHILVDGNRFKPYAFTPHQCIVKGDAKFASIAAASILAKTYRDDLMQKLHAEFPHYDWKNNMGYPTEGHRKAIEKFGRCKWHRMTFKVRSQQA
jgi:ribonuclease HII